MTRQMNVAFKIRETLDVLQKETLHSGMQIHPVVVTCTVFRLREQAWEAEMLPFWMWRGCAKHEDPGLLFFPYHPFLVFVGFRLLYVGYGMVLVLVAKLILYPQSFLACKGKLQPFWNNWREGQGSSRTFRSTQEYAALYFPVGHRTISQHINAVMFGTSWSKFGLRLTRFYMGWFSQVKNQCVLK